MEQADGAAVWVKQVGKNKFNVMVENAEGKIVTFMKGKTQQELTNVSRNYGWGR